MVSPPGESAKEAGRHRNLAAKVRSHGPLPDAHLALLPGSSEARREYRWSLFGALVLSLATFASAWCGYQASEWNGVSAEEAQNANGHRFVAARQAEVFDQHLTIDLMTFSDWWQAELAGNTVLAAEMEARFLPRFRPAFDQWRSQPIPTGTTLPPGTPFDQPVYMAEERKELDAANARVEGALDAVAYANKISSQFVLTSVLFASVLFLAGIASNLIHRHLGHAVVAGAGVVMIAAIALLLSTPMQL